MRTATLLLLFLLIGASPLQAKYRITKAANPNFCTTYPSGYSSISFALSETSLSGTQGFKAGQTNATFILGFSNAAFQFNPGIGTVTATGTDVTIVSYSITSTSITVTINTGSFNTELNTINFNNIEVKATSAATGYIKRTGGTFRIDNKATNPYNSSFADLTAGTPMAYSSASATQGVTSSVFSGTADNQVIGIQVVITGTCANLTATAFNLNTTGSTAPATDISNASLYYTGTTNLFSTATLFGSTSNPSGSYTITGSQSLSLGAGTYYFWLTYTIATTAVSGDVTDAQLVSSVISGSTFTTAFGNPAGSRTISTNNFYSIATGNWSNTSIWSRTSGGASCGCAPIGGNGFVYVNHAVTVDNNYTVDNVAVQNSGNLTNAAGKILTVNNTLSTSGTGLFSASAAWILNNLTTGGTGTSASSSALTLTGSLNVGTGSAYQMTGGAALTINGNVTVDGTLALATSNLTSSNAAGTLISGTGTITGSGIITLGVNKTIPTGSNLTVAPVINISNSVTVTNNGTVSMQNSITGGGVNAAWINAAGSVLNMGGSTAALMATGSLDASAVPNTVNYNGSGNQTIKIPSTAYYNLYLASSAAGVKSLASAIIVNNDIQLSSGAQLNVSANSITINGNWINNSTNATPFISTGTVSFNDVDTISGSAVTSFSTVAITTTGFLISNSSAGKVVVSGNWANDGDFDHNNGDIIFNGTSTVSGASVTDFNTVIVNSTKTLTLPASETDFDGDLTVNGTLNHNNGLIVFTGNGVVQNLNGATSALTCYQLELDNAAGSVLLSKPVTVNNLLTLTSGNLILGSNNLTLAATVPAVVGSPFSAANMIVASGTGAVIKNGTSAASASYTFPVGDNTGTPEYSPVTLTFTSGTYTSGSASVRVVNAKHPNNTSTINYISRYWPVATTGYTVTNAAVTVIYAEADVTGAEANLLMSEWTGSSPWVTFSSATLNTFTNTFTSPSLTTFGDFTAMDNSAQWTGNVSTDWATAGNWNTGTVPGSLTSVAIPSTATRMPSVTSSVSCNWLTINSGATVTNTNTGTLNIAGTFTNNGTYTDNGTTVFNGTAGQQTFTGVTAFNNLTVNNTSSLLSGGAVTVNNALLLTAGTLSANNFNLIVKGNWTNNVSATAFTAGTSTVSFSGTAAQIIGGIYSTTFNNLISSNTTGGVSLSVNTSISGDLTISSGTLDLAAFTANRTSSGGSLTVSNNATLKIGGTNTYPANYTTNTLVVASTVEYAGASQTVANQLYGNLKLSSSSGTAIKTFPGSALTVVGNLSSTLGTGSSVSFTAASDITVSGNVSIGASTTFNGSSFSCSIGGNWVNTGTFNGNTGTIIFTGAGAAVSGAGTQNFNNLTVAAVLISFSNSSITLTGNLATTGSGSFSQASGGTLLMTGAGTTISGTGISPDNLTISGSVSTVASLSITGNLSVSGSLTASTGTITMSGASKNILGAGILSFAVLSVTGTVTTDAGFSISSSLIVAGSLTASAGTATFTGTSTLSGTANLFNLTVNGTSLQLSANSVAGISGVLTITSGTLNVTSSTPNTVNFNGTGAQNINAITYNNLTLSNGNSKTAVAGITVNNDITIATGTTFIPGSYTHVIYNDWYNYGTFIAGSGTIQFSGSQNTNITGATTFNILTVNNTSPTTAVILQNNVAAATVNMTMGTILTGSNTLTITTTRTGNGIILGTIQRTHAFTTGVAYAFEGPDNSISFSSVSSVSSVTVSVAKGTISDFPFGGSISRVYNITVPAGTYNATLRLHYEDDELNGSNESSMGLWNYNGSAWAASGKTANSTTANYVEQSALTNITNRWTCSDNSNVVQWNGSVSTAWNTAANWTVLQGSASTPPSATDIVDLGTATFSNHPTISTAVTVKNIIFGSVQALTLSMAGGGSLISGDIHGSWAGSITHTINANNQTITVNGDLSLSDGASGHAINLAIGTGTVSVGGSLTESGGANITFSGAGNLNIAADYNYVNGTFTPGTGTVTYSGPANQAIGAVTYNNLTINKAAAIASVNNALTVGGNLSVTAGELDNLTTTTIAGNVTIASGAIMSNFNVLHVGGNWNNNGTYNGTGINVVFDGSGTQTISATTFNNLEFNKPVGSVAILTGDVTLKGNLVGTSGTLDIGSYFFNRDVTGGSATMANAATLIIAADNAPNKFANYYLSPGSTIIFNGTGTQHLLLPGLVYGNLIFRNSGSKILYTATSVTGDFTIESGATFNAGSNTITLNGNWTNSGIFISSTSTIVCTGAAKTVTGGTTFNHLTVSGSYTFLNNMTINGLLNITSTGSLSGGSSIAVTMNGDLINSGILYNLGSTTFTGNVLQTLSLINAVQTVAITVNFNGSVSPVLNSTSVPQYGFLNINNTGGVNPSVGWVVAYGLTVSSGGIFNGGPSSHTILGYVTNNGTITSNGTITFTPSSAVTVNLGSNFTSTGRVNFSGAGAMILAGTPVSFKNVTINNTNAAGITPSSDWLITNEMRVVSGSVLNAGNHSYTIGGNILNNGTINSSTSAFTMNGVAAQDIYSGSAFNNLSINNTGGFVTLSSNVAVNGALNFIAGNIQTGTNTLTQSSTGTLTNAAQNTGWVNGKLQKYMPTGATSKTFEIGDASNYTPALLAFSTITTAGNLTASTTGAEHPNISTSNINAAKSVNRYFTLTNSGITFTNYTATLNFTAADVDAGASTTLFDIAAYNGTSWSWPSATVRNATSIQATAVTSFGDFAIGQICNRSTTISYTASPYCTNAGTASVTLTGTSGGIFSADTNLSINAATGAIDLITSTPGTYTVTYTIAAAGDCSQFVTTASVTVDTANTWSGAVSNDWNNTGNWSCGGIPASSADVTIPSGLSVYPVITGTIPVHDINISAGATLTVNGGILQIGGSINNAGTFDVSAGTVQMKGTVAQTIPAGSFAGNNILNLIIGNNVTLAGQQNVTGALSFSTSNATLTTGGYLTLKSTASGTARLSDITNGGTISGNSIAGNVTIERYISAGREWRLLSAPVCTCTAPTINAAWQEGVTTGNPNPGYGTAITGGTSANGFDQGVNNNAAFKYYNNTTNSFVAVPGTYAPITSYNGYFLFIRGDRSTNLSLGVNAALTPTILRVKGQVLTGNVAVNVNALNYTLAGNPYPAAIDFHTLTKNNVNDKFYLWDPKMGTTGGYVTLIWNGTNGYDATTSVSPASRYIPSGEAFFIESLDGVNPGTITFKETDKNAGGSDQLFRPVYGNEKIRVNLLGVNTDGSASFTDGVLSTYNDNNSNNVDRNDAAKILNQSENLCINRNNKNLAIERRKTIDGNDTTFLNLYSLKKQTYMLQITAEAMENSGLYAVVKDNYAATTNNTMVNMGGVTNVTFTVNSDPASYATNRFSIVFAKQIALPVTFTGVKASRTQKNIRVEWNTINELNTKGYEVQSSATGSNFITVAVINKNPSGSAYNWLDENAEPGWHYYRIRLLEIDGNEKYSPVVKVSIDNSAAASSIVVNGNSISNNKVVLQFNNVQKDNYRMQLFSMDGRLLKQVDISHDGGNGTHDFLTGNNLAAGKYQVNVTGNSETFSIGLIKK
ncbi:MAG: hypothetical protein JWR61_5157 [Ferruginibacter sp.]|uniref:BNR-repeat neuraminidase N-terminal domain-containing protein n=1 Tax=Ferruginibacter sp. TaxID=1940288 RepID=UPI002657D10E|nr:BNR-repeat neuraminidase N-terminal domain-containing protein [Ferruginibacter sp.]MDB5280202.1 hypothetical protein [Ferruginibacter sp.]